MAIDFFISRCMINNITAQRFGICDPGNGAIAYPDFADESSWVALVENRSGSPLNFIAVDNCIEIRRPDGNMDNRCDAILTNSRHIIFVELKNQDKDWIGHAVNDQLQTTIDHFKANHQLDSYPKRDAYACNKSHPHFNHSQMERMTEFKNKNDVRLHIDAHIIIK